MSKKKNSGGRLSKILLSPGANVVMFLVAAALLLFAGIGGARATLTYFTETYSSRIQMYDIGVTLIENGEDVSYRNYNSAADGTWDEVTGQLLLHMLDAKDSDGNAITNSNGDAVQDRLKIGAAYPEVITIRNSGNIRHWARVTLRKYWVDGSGNKATDLDPDKIDLNLVNVGSNGPWILDKDASTDERTVLYYSSLLDVDEVSVPLSDTIKIDEFLARKITQTTTTTQEGKKKIIRTTYDYNGYSFVLEATVDAVQEHNGEDAVLSAWGRDVSISGEKLSLK